MSVPSPDRIGRRGLPATSLRHSRTPAVVLLALYLQACTSWVQAPLPPRQLIETAEPPRSIRITRPDGSKQVIRDPRIQGDSIASTAEDCRTSIAAVGRVSCEQILGIAALDDVWAIEVERANPAKTIGLVVISVPVALALAFVVASYADCGSVPCG